MDILKEKYEKSKINEDEYNERIMIIDDDDWWDSDNPSFMKLKEQYANCEIDSPEYLQKINQIKDGKNNTALTILKERYANSE